MATPRRIIRAAAHSIRELHAWKPKVYPRLPACGGHAAVGDSHGSGNRVGQQLQFCWEVTPDNKPYSYTIRQVSPARQVVRPATSHPGGDDCMVGDIKASDVGTLIIRVEVTMDGKTVGAQVSRTIVP